MGAEEVVVTLGGLPRPATVIAREGDLVHVRYRHAGGYEQRWVPSHTVVAVEPTTERPSLVKVVGLAVLALLGLLLVFWPGGSNAPLLPPGPTPTASVSP